MAIVQERVGKIKGLLDSGLNEWGIAIIVVLVGLSSFGLGRLSAAEDVQPIVSMSQASATTGATGSIVIGGQVVASRKGGAYHYPWCPGALTMKESNKVWFKDEAAARAAGYKPAGNCEGLK